MAVKKIKHTSKNAKTSKLTRALNLSTTKGKFLLFILIFAIVGGGYMVYHSFANVPPPKVLLRYERPIADAYAEVESGEIVVVSPQANDANDREAVRLIEAKGGIPYRYFQWYWLPNDRLHDGVDIRNNPEWAFCADESTALTDTKSHPGQTWTYLDMNERQARNTMTARLRHLKSLGYKGIFSDIGDRALTENQLDDDGYENDDGYADAESTCTDDLVVKDRTLAKAYVGMLNQVRSIGLDIILNGGSLEELDELASSGSKHIRDALNMASYVMDEGAAKTERDGGNRLNEDARIAAKWGFKALTLIRPPKPTKPINEAEDRRRAALVAQQWANAAVAERWARTNNVPAVQVVAGVRSGGQP